MLPIKPPAYVPGNVRPLPRLHEADASDCLQAFLISPGHTVFERYAVEFERWCKARARASLPASDETIALYLKHRWESPGPPNSIAVLRNHYTGIRSLQYMNGYECGTSGLIQRVLRMIEKRAPAPKKAEPLMRPDAQRFIQLAMLDQCRIRAARDRLLFSLRPTMARTGELCNIRIEDIVIPRSGAYLRIRVVDAKTNKGGPPEYLWATRSHDLEVCPVRAYRDYLAISGLKSGPLLRGIDGHKLRDNPMSVETLEYTVRKYARLAGLLGKYTGYSIRRGGVTGAVAGTGDSKPAQRRARHKHSSTTEGYIAHDRIGPYGPDTDQIM